MKIYIIFYCGMPMRAAWTVKAALELSQELPGDSELKNIISVTIGEPACDFNAVDSTFVEVVDVLADLAKATNVKPDEARTIAESAVYKMLSIWGLHNFEKGAKSNGFVDNVLPEQKTIPEILELHHQKTMEEFRPK